MLGEEKGKTMNRPFASNVALITGGTADIGKAAAHLFAQEGAKVVIAGRRSDRGRQTEQELQAAGGSVLYVQTDVARPDQGTLNPALSCDESVSLTHWGAP